MTESILEGHGAEINEWPQTEWEEQLAKTPSECAELLRFMSEDHHRVRYHVVENLPRLGHPLTPEAVAEALKLPPTRVRDIFRELDEKLFFLVRNGLGAVSWAFPVTVDATPHHLSFSTGERLDAA